MTPASNGGREPNVSERATGIPGSATAQPMSAGATAEGQVSATVTRSETSGGGSNPAAVELEEEK